MSVPPDQLTRQEPPAPEMKPRSFMGRPVSGVGLADRGPIPRSFFEAAGSEFSFRTDQMVERWRMVGEPAGEPLLQEEFTEIVGERDIAFEPGITANEAERRVMFHDFEQWESRMQGRPVAALLGGIGPMILDPVNVATMPLGGANFARMAGAKTLGTFLGQGALGGAKAGVASAPLELAFQRGETAQLRPGELAGTVLGPIALSPVFGAAGRAARSLFKRVRNAVETNEAGRNNLTRGDTDPEEAAGIIRQADRDGVPPPPVTRRTAQTNTPVRRLQDTFADYQGGHRQWVRDLAAGRVAAAKKLDQLGIARDDPAIERMVDRLSRESDIRSGTPTDYNFKLLDTFNQFRRGEALDADQARVLAENGLTKPVVRAGEVAEPVLSNTGRRLQEALDAPREVRNAKLLREVNRDGAGAVRRELEGRARRAGAEAPEFTPRIIDDEFSDREVIAALESARTPAGNIDARGPDAVPPRRKNVVDDAPEEAAVPARTEDASVQEMLSWATARGIDTNDINTAVNEAAKRAIACGR